jgi:hypothetical protein
MKGIVEASRKEALRQRDSGIAPPEDNTDGSPHEVFPDADEEERVPAYVPEETHGRDTIPRSTETMGDSGLLGVSRTNADQGNQRGPTTSKGKEKVGYSSESERACFRGGSRSPHSAAHAPSDNSRGVEAAEGHSGAAVPEVPTSAELAAAVPETPAPADPALIPGGSGIEVGQAGKTSENQAVDSSYRGRQPGKRKASFSPGRPTPKIPRVVAYVDSSSDGEGEGAVQKSAGAAPSLDQDQDDVEGLTDSPRVASTAKTPETSAGGSGSFPQTDDPTPEIMLRAMASGQAYIGEDHWSQFRVGTVSDRLCNFFNSASYVSNALVTFSILPFLFSCVK